MKEKDWIKFKLVSEEKFKTAVLQECYGFQIQKDTKWNDGLSISQIEKLEYQFGFKLPYDYFELLKVCNGFKTLQISVDPDGHFPNQFARRCYQYPVDLENTKPLIEEVNNNIKYAKICLDLSGFNSSEVEGFVPLFGHRVLAVLKDKTKTPVLSIWGDDIILYGNSLMEYWCHELNINFNHECVKTCASS